MPKLNSKYAIIAGTINPTTWAVSYMGAVLPATYAGRQLYKLTVGDQVVVDRRIPSTALTILGLAFGDTTNGSVYSGTAGSGGIVQPSDAPGGTAAGTAPVSTGGYLTLDTGPGFDMSHLHP